MELVLEKQEMEAFRQVFERLGKESVELRKEPVRERKKFLRLILNWITTHRKEIKEALFNDFRKPPLETDISEIYPIISEIRHTLRHLDRWTQPHKVDATISYLGTWSEVRLEPKGNCLIISPWNFPFNLCIGPLISCIAAGNTAIVKPSELTPHTSALIKKMIDEIFKGRRVAVAEGGVEVASCLLQLPFDHIFFTGSPAIGKVVMKAAADHLASVTLELGGKSPVVVDKSAHLKSAAKRIAFGKFINNGQTCIAPDYLLVHEKIVNAFIHQLKKETLELFGDGKKIDEQSTSYSRLVNRRHFKRVNELIKDAIERGARTEMSGTINEQENFIHPMLLSDVSPDSRIMEEEIFGPVLPILTFTDINEVIRTINGKPKPLALYLFGRKSFRSPILKATSAGTVCENDCITQFTHPNLPFGGVNHSGIGKAHGHAGVLAFSNEKSVLRAIKRFSLAYVFHPPFTTSMQRIVNLILRWF
jgi:aldehyde dehydrogenase (NAD+)